jgi:NAD(P)-dependent dehydrogenase (short-subunit alcohol dehydrogenase family)
MTLQDKRIVVLGGTSGIGLAVAQAAARQGADLVVVSSQAAKVEAALAAFPPGVQGHAVDLSVESAVGELFAAVGALDHLVYCAGEALTLQPLAADLGQVRRFWEVRYWGALAAAKHAAGRLRPGGSIVFAGGTAGQRPLGAGWGPASSICSAMEGLTRALAVELAPLRVNCVAPGVVRTPLWSGMADGDRTAFYAAEAERLPVGHVGEPSEVAEAYLYLMRQTYVTGQTVWVDGGGLLA